MGKIEITKSIVFLAALMGASIHDIKTKEISLKILFIMGIAGIFLLFFSKTDNGWSITALLPGLMLLGLSILSEGQVGFGDGLLVCVSGLYFSLADITIWLFFAFILAGIFGVIFIRMKKYTKRTSLPFIPFLFVSALIGEAICAVNGF